VDIQIPVSSYQSWAQRGRDGQGFHRRTFDYEPEQYKDLALSDEIAAFAINFLFEDVQPLYTNPAEWTYRELVLTFDFHGFENLFAASSLQWIKVPLFFGQGGGGGGGADIYGSTRAQSMLLNMSDTNLPVDDSDLLTKKDVLKKHE
jgi:hypothetical protein